MIEGVEFTRETGTKDSHDVTVYALSTCGFCKRAIAYLRDNSVQFKYVYVDMLNFEIKQDLKKALAEKYSERVVFPFLVVDDSKCSAGFIEEEWNRLLSV